MEKPSDVHMNGKVSIENEPRTLNMKQLQLAREAALHVVKTKSVEEALSIFTEGLEPSIRIASQKGETMPDTIKN